MLIKLPLVELQSGFHVLDERLGGVGVAIIGCTVGDAPLEHHMRALGDASATTRRCFGEDGGAGALRFAEAMLLDAEDRCLERADDGAVVVCGKIE